MFTRVGTVCSHSESASRQYTRHLYKSLSTSRPVRQRIPPPSTNQQQEGDDELEEFSEHVGELYRRKRRIEEKRRQKGGDFVDYLVVTVRGGKGGSGTSSFLPSRRGLGPPSGGNGGTGGSVYLSTSPHLTSLSTVPKRLIGGQGLNGSGNYRHGRRGIDTTVLVPIGTVVREISREGEFEKVARDEAAMTLAPEERRARRRERWFVKHPAYEVDEKDMREAETMLRSAGRWGSRTPSFEEEPPFQIDITHPIPTTISKSNLSQSSSFKSKAQRGHTSPVLLASGGLGGLGNPHFETPTTRSPRLASRGVQPPTRTFIFELKLLADVGLVGFPNAGKSTILRALTGRRAEVAGYAFTTLNPQVGVVKVFKDGTWGGDKVRSQGVVEETEVERERERRARASGEYIPLPAELAKKQSPVKDHTLDLTSTPIPTLSGIDTFINPISPESKSDVIRERLRFTISDNPGLLARASENVGLGHSFLRSIERSLALAYVLDATRADPARDMLVLRAELEAYQPGLAGKVRVVVLNKADTAGVGVGAVDTENDEGGSAVSGTEGPIGGEGLAETGTTNAEGNGVKDLQVKLDKIKSTLFDLPESKLDDGTPRIKVIIVSGKYGSGMTKLVDALSTSVEEARRAAREEEAREGDGIVGDESGPAIRPAARLEVGDKMEEKGEAESKNETEEEDLFS